jgi:hypothetical protein
MPLTATYEDIKAYQEKLEKNKITPHSLPPCPSCNVDSRFFKIHAYRERQFLIIVKMIIQKVFYSLIRFKCPGCGKTVTFYPDFALPHKHYTRQTITAFADACLKADATYQKALMIENETPGYPNSDATLAASSIHRWIGSLSSYTQTSRNALALLIQENPTSSICRDLAKWRPQARKLMSTTLWHDCCAALYAAQIPEDGRNLKNPQITSFFGKPLEIGDQQVGDARRIEC